MKLKILTFLLLFSLSSFSSFAIIDIKKKEPTERIQNFKKENFSKKKKFKKRKFRLRDLFRWKKKIKKVKPIDETKIIPSAWWSLSLGILGTLIILLPGFSFLVFLIFIALQLSALILGILALKGIERNPQIFRGKNIAWAGITIFILWTLLILAFFIWLIFIYGN